ncbi:MAG: winged helix-turn-helix domain-containing protein [Gemmiger formicilis]|uniref:winged helix-turn-helix domain-containing protein n=1 Tax=Gemmiger formicilis TaxID=745368 RepID=UPI00399A2523
MKYYKNLSINESDFSVQKQGRCIHLTAIEYQLFLTLLDHSGYICSRNFLLASAWHITMPIQTRTVDVHIAKLREKLDLGPDDLKTVMGRGYTLSMQKSCGTSRSLGESLYSDR